LSESFVTIALLFFKQNRNSQQKVFWSHMA